MNARRRRLLRPGGHNQSLKRTRGILGLAGLKPAGGAFLVLVLLGAPVGAEPEPPIIEKTRKQLENRSKALVETEQKAKSLQTDMADIEAERARLNMQLLETGALVQRSEARLTAIEARVDTLELREGELRKNLANRHGQISKLLGALQRMGRNPPPAFVTRRQDALEMVRSAMMLASAFPDMKDEALALNKDLDDLMTVKNEINTEGEKLRAEMQSLREGRFKLSSLLEEKKLTLASRQDELAAVRQASAAISSDVKDLNELIAKLDSNVAAAPAGETSSEPEVAPPQLATAPTQPPAANPAPSGPQIVTPPPALPQGGVKVAAAIPPPLKPGLIEIAPSSELTVSAANAGRISPAIPFKQAHAKLPLPAQGRFVAAYGEATQYGGKSKGIVIETRSGAQITSPCDGWILYAGEFRSYGQLLIINAGDGYHVLLAGLSQIDVQPGQFVLAAEPVGTMSGVSSGDPSQARGRSPVLYVEFRKDGRPIDPAPWWVTGQQKVQG